MTWSTTAGYVGLGIPGASSPALSDFTTFNTAISPRAIDLILLLQNLDSEPLFWSAYSTWPAALDATFISTMSPSAHKLSDFTSGTFDSTGLYGGGLQGLAAQAVAYGGPIILRLCHEFNGTWNAYGHSHETAAQFVAGWQHVHSVFATAGATNVIWFWCPNVWNVPGGSSAASDPTVDDGSGSSWYPGDAYVDLIGLDGYMMTTNSLVNTPADLFLANYTTMTAAIPTKPFAIGEFGVAEQSRLSSIGGKAGWYDLFFDMVRNDMPKCVLACQWERSVAPDDTTINSSSADTSAAAAFKAGIIAPRFVRGLGSSSVTGLRLAGSMPLESDLPIVTSVSYFTVPLSIAFATDDAPSTSVTGTSRITLVDGSSAALAVDGLSRITAVA